MNIEKHIVFICSRLDLPGGTERGIVNAANQLCVNHLRITLLVLDVTPASFYPLHPAVQIVQHPMHFGITESGTMLSRKIAFVNHIRNLKKIINSLQPDVVIGTEYVFTIAAKIALYRLAIKLYSWEHHHFYWLKRSRFWNILLKKIYPQLDCIICLNATEAAIYKGFGCKTVVIPYYVKQAAEQAPLESKTILTIGWLIRRKGVDLIPEIAERVFKRHPDWKWKIIGTGEEHGLLKKLIAEKGLGKNIEIIPPSTPDLHQAYLTASVYVMLSRHEGLPFVLLEAMSYGVPCIAFDCLSGPSNIIQNNADGFLIQLEDTEAMSEAILKMIEDNRCRIKMGVLAYRNIERFSPANVLKLWQQLLQS